MNGVIVESDRRTGQIRKLTEISRALTYATSIETVLGVAVDRAVDLLEAHRAVLMLRDDGGLLHVRASHGLPQATVERFREPLDEGLIDRLQGLFGDLPADSFLAVPLVAQGNVSGMLAVVRDNGEPSTDVDEWLLSAIADQVAVALETARLSGAARREVESSREELQELTDSRERALATMAHELRTPLHAIESYAELLELAVMGPVTDRQREAIGRIRMSGRHLLSILDNVLDMARLNAGVLRCSPVRVEATRVLEEATQLVVPSAAEKGQTLTVHEPRQQWVRADPARLRQVLTNILGNAIKYTPPDGRIEVMASPARGDGAEWCAIAIRDTGPGIPADQVERIFEPYFRSTTAGSEAGSGLGLSIARELVRQMGGTLEVESREGKGSTFTIRLVSWRDAVRPAAAGAAARPRSSGGPAD